MMFTRLVAILGGTIPTKVFVSIVISDASRDRSPSLPFEKSSPDPEVAAFSAWLTDECGATGIENLFLGEFPRLVSGREAWIRGVGALKPIKHNDLFFCLPDRCRFAAWNAPRRLQKLLRKEGCRGNKNAVLAIWLAEELRTHSLDISLFTTGISMQ